MSFDFGYLICFWVFAWYGVYLYVDIWYLLVFSCVYGVLLLWFCSFGLNCDSFEFGLRVGLSVWLGLYLLFMLGVSGSCCERLF